MQPYLRQALKEHDPKYDWEKKHNISSNNHTVIAFSG